MEIRALEPRDATICDVIVASLPYHFAQPEGRRQCADAVRQQAGLVACLDETPVGFLTYQHHFDDSSEITWMAVHGDHRRHGIGHELIDRLCELLRTEGRRYLLVLTVSPTSDSEEEPPDGYQATRAFYSSTGFSLARDFVGYWDNDIPVLMVRTI